MNFNRIRDLVANLGRYGENEMYIVETECLAALERLEDELLNEDVANRNVRISLHFSETVKNDLIPILCNSKDAKVVAIATRILVNLSLPMEYLLPLQTIPVPSMLQNVRSQLADSLLAVKNAFLDTRATLAIVTVLRETMIKSEKYQTPLKDEECNHLKNCLTVIRNILHLPEYGMLDQYSAQNFSEWQSLQSKLIWNLFVQGIDGALLLMLNSKYRKTWTVPLSLIIASLYRNQNIGKVHQALEQISSSSESSGDDEESDGSKNSSTSLSSEPSKFHDPMSDSGYQATSDVPLSLKNKRSTLRQLKPEHVGDDCTPTEIHKKLEKVKISDHVNYPSKMDTGAKVKVYCVQEDHDSESSSSSEYPYHKKIKGNCPSTETQDKEMSYYPESDSAIGSDHGSKMLVEKSSDEDVCQATLVKNLEAVQKLKSFQLHKKMSESDSSTEDANYIKMKYRSHPPTGRRGKSPRRNSGCTPAICMSSAYEESAIKGRIKYPLWGKRNSVATLVDKDSPTPSDDDIGNLLKEFTLSFMHSGFSQLVIDLQNVLLEGPSFIIDKSLFYWTVSYFLPLATASNVCLEHISNILSVDIIGYLVFECVNACENMQLNSQTTEQVAQYLSVSLILLVTALKEVICAVDFYSHKCNAAKDKNFFNDLCGKLMGLQDIRLLPLLLFQNYPKADSQKFLADVVVLNHVILIISGRESSESAVSNKIHFATHLKSFATRSIVDCYGKVLESFKSNSHFLNECVFTMLHHLAGDLHSSELFFAPKILKSFSDILKEDTELEQYQEDLILYILNKFSMKMYVQKMKAGKSASDAENETPSTSSSLSSNCLLSGEDDLFWWYLQFQQDKDPITRISELIPASKEDILSKLQLKGHITSEKRKQLEEKMREAQEKIDEDPNDERCTSSNFDDEITYLLRTLVQCGERPHLIWLQNTLLETCYCKLGVTTHPPEPIPLYCIRMMLSVPLIPYSDEQKTILKNETFLQLLVKLGLHLGSQSCPMYPRIPLFWTPEILFTVAARLGPIKKEKIKFTEYELLAATPNNQYGVLKIMDCPKPPPLSSCGTLSSWLTAVQQNKESYRMEQIQQAAFE